VPFGVTVALPHASTVNCPAPKLKSVCGAPTVMRLSTFVLKVADPVPNFGLVVLTVHVLPAVSVRALGETSVNVVEPFVPSQ